MSFDAIAPWYRALETIAFRKALQRARVACLDEIGSPRHVLIVGEGNGRFLEELLQRHSSIEVDCVDASERMLALTRHAIDRRTERVRFLQRDITSWTPPAGEYDLIVTHFFLDCFSTQQVGHVVAKLAQAAAPIAIWLLADFRIPKGGFARAHARTWLAVMYGFFRLVAGIEANELVDPSPFLRVEGFTLGRQRLFRLGMVKSELWRKL